MNHTESTFQADQTAWASHQNNESSHTKLIGFYNEYGYRIEDNLDGAVLYTAGNNPLESSSVVSLNDGLPMKTIKEYCGRTGLEMAEEIGGEWIGAEYETWEDCACCGMYHPLGFAGDCRDDRNRF